MADVKLEKWNGSGGVNTLYFRAGSMEVNSRSFEPQQIRTEAEDLTVRVANMTTNRRKLIHVNVKQLQESAESDGGTSYKGYTAFKAFVDGTLDYSSLSARLTDADGDVYIVRYWEPIPLEFQETKQGIFEGRITFREEN